jgi:CubicO group peptidase (beta-lactamase class C family)
VTSLPEGLTGQATPSGSEKAGGTARSGRSGGAVASGFEPVRQQFDSFLREDSSYSAQLVVHVGDDVVVDLWGGPVLGQTSITGVYSVSKGITALVIALLIQDGTLALEEPVASWWPEFGVHGKQTVTVRQLLTHQAALINAVPTLTPEQFLDPRVAAARLADTIPVWRPGAAFGYHALTIGPLVEELVRRAAGHSLQHLWNQRVRKPHEVDFFLGLPASEDQRYVPLQPATSATPVEPPDAGGLPEHALGLSEPFSPNLRLVRAGGSASIGAVGSARGLAQAYASVITSSSPLLEPTTLAMVSQLQVDGHDLVLDQHMRFGVLFMKPRPASLWGSWRAIGHDGAAGALGFADPDHRIAFGYIPNPAPERGGADPRAVALSATVRECVRAQVQSAQIMRAATSADAARATQKLHKRPQIG